MHAKIGDTVGVTFVPNERQISGLFKVSAKTFAEGLRFILRVQDTASERDCQLLQKKTFSLSNGSLYSILLPLTFLASMVELPILHLFVHMKFSDSGTSVYWHLSLLVANLLGLVWLIGDQRAVRKNRHIVSDAFVLFRVGYRLEAKVMTSSLRDAKLLLSERGNAAKELGCDSKDVTHITPFDFANVAIELTTPSSDFISRWGRKTLVTKYLCIYVDDPHNFVREINSIADAQ